jgi:pimeloyl-ACP methyl ester carboxylesterase
MSRGMRPRRHLQRREVHLWQGEADTLVPPVMGRYQAGQIPHCRATLLPGEGHLLVIDRMPDLINAFRAGPERTDQP